jgi:phosphoribosyl 1,2-cyclic phosphodiesterase
LKRRRPGPRASDMQFTPLASSSKGNAYTISDGTTTVMLECGLPWKKLREALNFKTSEISGILLTHKHMDHCRGVKDAAKAGMDLYASKGTFDALQIAEHRANVIKAEEQFTIGTWTILPFATVHDNLESLGFYMVGKDGEAFLFLTDSGYSPVKFKNLSVIAVECNFIEEIMTEKIINGGIPAAAGHRIRRAHMSLEATIGMLKANDLSKCRQIWLLHLSNGNSDEAKMIRAVQEATGVPVYVCEE